MVDDGKCTRFVCDNDADQYHRLDNTWYCRKCAQEIQEHENTMKNPKEIFKEFYQKPIAKAESTS